VVIFFLPICVSEDCADTAKEVITTAHVKTARRSPEQIKKFHFILKNLKG
jgi:hypothetical protein